MLYDYLSWIAGYTNNPAQEEPTEPEQEKKEEPVEEPVKEPVEEQTQSISIAQLETEQENIVPVYSFLIYPKRNRRKRG